MGKVWWCEGYAPPTSHFHRRHVFHVQYCLQAWSSYRTPPLRQRNAVAAMPRRAAVYHAMASRLRMSYRDEYRLSPVPRHGAACRCVTGTVPRACAPSPSSTATVYARKWRRRQFVTKCFKARHAGHPLTAIVVARAAPRGGTARATTPRRRRHRQWGQSSSPSNDRRTSMSMVLVASGRPVHVLIEYERVQEEQRVQSECVCVCGGGGVGGVLGGGHGRWACSGVGCGMAEGKRW